MLTPHFNKVIYGEPRTALMEWLLAGNRFELWGFPGSGHRRMTKNADGANVLNSKFLKITAEITPTGYEFFSDETTELVYFGFSLPLPPSLQKKEGHAKNRKVRR
jgi:hypothetical protein